MDAALVISTSGRGEGALDDAVLDMSDVIWAREDSEEVERTSGRESE